MNLSLRSSLRVLPLAAAFALVFPGCLVTADSDPGPGGTVVCVGTPDGAACEDDSECCSNVCDAASLTCATPVGGCFEDTSACQADGDCCSGICDTGSLTCAISVCADVSAPCSTDGDCCDNNYCDETSGSTCQVCLDSGASCGSDLDCCSSACDPSGTCN
jgi:hypothetical protein